MANLLRVLVWTLMCGLVAAPFAWVILRENPAALRHEYERIVLAAVPPGSTEADFDKAAMSGKITDCDIMLNSVGGQIVYVYWTPIQLWNCDFFVTAEPAFDAKNRISGYEMTSGAHFFSDVPVFRYPR